MPLTGFEEFKAVFGSITVLDVTMLVLAIVFCYLVYRKVSKYLIERYEAGKEKDKQLKTALDAVSKYPEYRAQSIRIQEELQNEIEKLRGAQAEQTARLKQMEDNQTRSERNRLRDRLLQSYRYYTDPTCNPAGVWNSMEAEAFWEMFSEYEDRGGNGYIHTVVQPAMNLLRVVEIGEPMPGRSVGPGVREAMPDDAN